MIIHYLCIDRSNTAAIAVGVIIPLLFACFVVIIVLSVAIYMYIVRRRRFIPMRREPIVNESVNDTFTVNEPVDSPDVPDAESEFPIGEAKEDIEPPAPVPEPIRKTVVQKTILDDFSAFV